MSDLQWKLVEYTAGRGLEITNGTNTAFPHFIKTGMTEDSTIRLKSYEKLDLIAGNSLDFVVFTAPESVLCYINDMSSTIAEYFRVLKPGGYLTIMSEPNKTIEYAITNLKGRDIVESTIITQPYPDGTSEEVSFIVLKKLHNKDKIESFKVLNLQKKAIVVRYGAFGDQAQASSVYAGLKKQGYHLTLITQRPGCDVILHDKNIDKLVICDRGQVPNQALGEYFEYLKSKCDNFVNLCESVEGTLLAMTGRPAYDWTQEARHAIMDHNYVEFQHKLADVPHDPQIKFVSTPEEDAWAIKERKKMGKRVIMWSLTGSSCHKINTQFAEIMPRVINYYEDVDFLFVGGPEVVTQETVEMFSRFPKVHFTAGQWSIRQTLTMLNYIDVLFAPETGVANWAAYLPIPKIVFLSHSSVKNLTRDWVNTYSLFTPTEKLSCYPCHKLHPDMNYSTCNLDKTKGVAKCQSMMNVEDTWKILTNILDPISMRKNQQNDK